MADSDNAARVARITAMAERTFGQHCVAASLPALLRLSRSKLHKILRQGELRPHKIRCYVEKRDPDFEIKMASVLHVYKEVEIVNEYRRGEAGRQLGMVTISYDVHAASFRVSHTNDGRLTDTDVQFRTVDGSPFTWVYP